MVVDFQPIIFVNWHGGNGVSAHLTVQAINGHLTVHVQNLTVQPYRKFWTIHDLTRVQQDYFIFQKNKLTPPPPHPPVPGFARAKMNTRFKKHKQKKLNETNQKVVEATLSTKNVRPGKQLKTFVDETEALCRAYTRRSKTTTCSIWSAQGGSNCSWITSMAEVDGQWDDVECDAKLCDGFACQVPAPGEKKQKIVIMKIVATNKA